MVRVTDGVATVPCGWHKVEQTALQVPCGGEVFLVAPRVAPPPLERERRSTALMVAGIVIASVGVVGGSVGAVLTSTGLPPEATSASWLVLGVGIGSALLVGLPLIVYGATKVPRGTATGSQALFSF
jgi:hypothetical protein